MNTQKFNAPDMRQALKMVRDSLGADAVILSNRKVAGGVEIIAAADYGTFLAEHSAREREAHHVPPFMDASAPVVSPAQGDPARLIQPDKRQDPALAEQMKLMADQQRAQSASRQFNELLRRQLQEQRAQADAEPSVEISPQAQARQAQAQAPVKAPTPVAPRVQPAPGAGSSSELAAMRNELSQLRNMLNVQLANVSWGDFSYRHPLEANVFKRLTKLGLSPALCRKLTRNLAPEMDTKSAWQHALKELGEDLPLVTEDILAHGGIFAFVGPAGVGKTTTIAKLATRYVLEHGADDIALVTTDSYRIAGHEQLSTLGRILKIPVRVVTEQNSLEQILRGLARKKLVLIDTAGLSHKDQVHREQMKMLEAMGANIQRWLVLSSTCQRRILDKAIDDYKHLNLEGCVFTKLDESASLGEALSVAIEAQLPIAYITDGQNIPDDIARPQPSRLINHAIALAKENKADDSLVADLYSDALTAQSDVAYA
ncbi:MAG TPA: flagellar biosynthesis protein FlhF [Candidatus Kapabacteria bacterium]|nr:flagellar biosynthesis protein FlhF [Candidatus Kapabacteria bacterium]